MHCAFLSLLISAKYLSLGRRDPARYFHTHNPSSEQYVRLFIKRHITMPRQKPRRGFPQFFSGPTRSTGTFSGTFERSLFYIKFQYITIHFNILKYNNKTLQYIQINYNTLHLRGSFFAACIHLHLCICIQLPKQPAPPPEFFNKTHK